MDEATERQRNDWSGDAVLTRAQGVIGRLVAGEYLLVPIRKGLADLQAVFCLTGIGQHVWERLDGVTTLDAIIASVVERYQVTPEEARGDITAFLARLTEAGLAKQRS